MPAICCQILFSVLETDFNSKWIVVEIQSAKKTKEK